MESSYLYDSIALHQRMSLALVLPLSALLGLTLGLVGGGGAVLGIPLLVYLAGLSPESAIPMNLLIIALASLMGIWLGRRQRGLHRRAVFLIGGMGAIGAPLGASLTHRLTEPILLISMLSLMLLATLSIWKTREEEADLNPETHIQPCQGRRCALIGFGVGFLTGLLGVGGGVLLVPAMTFLARMPFRMASQTSMAITAINASVGFISHLSTPIDPSFAFIYLMMVLLGMILAQSIRHLLALHTLKIYFTSMMAAAAIVMLLHQWQNTLIP
ncbi:MAG: sulfite exporter TauE/SafE family protein [Verrucomicrobiales bacterium]